MARTGITGRKTEISPQTLEYLQAVRASCDLPLAVGFGLSEQAQVRALKPYAEIMIVGSALIKVYADQPLETALAGIEKFMQGLIQP
jgi:tryptophan synthase alpha chain